MYIIQHPYNDTVICMPDSPKKGRIHVDEIGHNSPPPGYTPIKKKRDCYIIHYLISGKGNYYGKTIEGPCVFLLTPDEPHFYTVDSSPDAPPWKQYWIIISGEGTKELLEDAGISGFPFCVPYSHIHESIEILQNLQTDSSYLNKNEHYHMMWC